MAHREKLVNYAQRLIRNREGAEDLVQEAWLRFASTARDPSQLAQPTNYLFAIVRNLAVDWLRRSSRLEPVETTTEVYESVPSDAPSAESVLYYRDRLRALEAALSGLPERTQVAFIMYRAERRTLQEIADHLGVSVPRVHKMVKDAIFHCALTISGADE
jgi:RNA polymerase sigma-70 factor (ECF subfamily)